MVSVVTSVPVLLLPVGLVITNPVMVDFHFYKVFISMINHGLVDGQWWSATVCVSLLPTGSQFLFGTQVGFRCHNDCLGGALHGVCRHTSKPMSTRLALELANALRCRNTGVPACFVSAWTDHFYAVAREDRVCILNNHTSNFATCNTNDVGRKTYTKLPRPEIILHPGGKNLPRCARAVDLFSPFTYI